MIFKIYLPKKLAKNLDFLPQNKAKLCKKIIITLVFGKCAIFSSEHCQKLQKIVIITSIPELGDWSNYVDFLLCYCHS
jgi:hypothetical protein